MEKCWVQGWNRKMKDEAGVLYYQEVRKCSKTPQTHTPEWACLRNTGAIVKEPVAREAS